MTAYEKLTIRELGAMLRSGEVTVKALTAYFLDRIERLDRSGPCLNAVLEVNPDAMALAEAMDREGFEGKGPLYGIPILVKDNINTGDRMHTSGGALALAGNLAGSDSAVAARLRAAGALLLGKANMTEMANFLSDHMPNGYSSRGGQVRNPYGPELDPGGSSAGSGAAAAAGLCAATVGTETNGSIMCPANFNRLVGVKPTLGLVSRAGILPICGSMDTAGPLARCVEDAALLLMAMAGADVCDAATHDADRFACDYAEGLSIDALRGKKLGLFAQTEASDEQKALLEDACAALKAAGAELIPVTLPSLHPGDSYTVMLYEYRDAVDAYLADCPAPGVHTMRELMEFNRADPEHCLRYGQAIVEAAVDLPPAADAPEYREAKDRILHELTPALTQTMEGLDALVFASWNSVAPTVGWPCVTVPMGVGKDTGTGMGLTFLGRAYSEAQLLAMAYAFEHFGGIRVDPRLE